MASEVRLQRYHPAPASLRGFPQPSRTRRRLKGLPCANVLRGSLPDEFVDISSHGSRKRFLPSIFYEAGSRLVDPTLNRWATPLQRGVVNESLRHWIPVRDQALQHHGEIHIGDRPCTEQIVRTALEQPKSRCEWFSGGFARLR